MYYLNSRYYNPEWGRFINVDALVGQTGALLAHNMFLYCSNNPVNRQDPSGYVLELINKFLAEITGTVNVVKPVYVFASASAAVDGPLPFGDAIGLGIAAVATIGVITYATFKAIDSTTTKTETIPHGNSKKSKKPQHGYEIYNINSGDVVKVGISGDKIRLDGKSYRAENQVRKFNREEGGYIYASRIMGYFPDRESALAWESLNSQFRFAQGHSMEYHRRPDFDNWWDIN